MTYYEPPCLGRDEWTRDSNKQNVKSAEDRQEDAGATLRAQFICTTQCEIRDTCLKKALATPAEDDWWVWGGYTPWERERIRNGGLEVPRTLKGMKVNWQRVDLFLAAHTTVEDLADYLDRSPSRLYTALRSYLLLLRIAAGDPWLILPEDESGENPCETANTVRAA